MFLWTIQSLFFLSSVLLLVSFFLSDLRRSGIFFFQRLVKLVFYNINARLKYFNLFSKVSFIVLDLFYDVNIIQYPVAIQLIQR